jgi:hypothetical protein
MGRVTQSMAAFGYTVAAVAVIVGWATWPLCLFVLYAIAAQVGLAR